eukprot:CAMPEP_0180214970 /NCGR_PEP_ID=MMETSP0987-20121128/15225_1 /TAXON_ID=697907 /ORGANISM="non described non described, Strain CCMP2293" /LENGTH=53 /DNA_ID=CAMNT_0022173555 /DNA_START=172 /DNA_END=333 /DNA_ORIENTATION=-
MVNPKLQIPLTVASALCFTGGAIYYRDHHWAPYLNGPHKAIEMRKAAEAMSEA